MIELPGSLAGSVISPMPDLGPEAIIRISLAILLSATASCLRAPCVSTIASCAANASNLFLAVTKGNPVN